MKNLMRSTWLTIAALAASLSAAQTTILVGSPDATEQSVKAVIGTRGQILGKTDGGFFIVRLKNAGDRENVTQQLKAAKIEYVFDEQAQTVDRHALPSLRRHIEYVRARHKVIKDTPETRKSAGFYEALAWYLEPRVGPDGTIDQDLVKRAVEHRDQMPPAWVGTDTKAPSASFSYVGPKNLDIPYQRYYGIAPLSGRVNGIGWSKSNPNVIYLATAGGGVWKTTDQGTNWSFRSSGWQFLHTTGIGVDPTNENHVIVGTGDYYGFFGAQTSGVMRSTNGGSSWTQVGAAQFGNNIVTRILFHPTLPNYVIALTAGATGDIYRSTDGGVTWAATDAPAGNWDDIDYGPVSGAGIREFYAVGGNSSAGGRIYRSTNQGGNWTVVNDATATSQTIMDVAVSKGTFGKVYVLHPNSNTMYRSTNSGTSWTNLNLTAAAGFPNALDASNPLYNWSQDTYDLYVETSQVGDTEYVWVGLITLALSTNSGATWTDFGRSYLSNSRLHNDQHCFATHPTLGYIGIAGGDGGVFRTTYLAGVLNSIASLNNNLYTTQFYHHSVHPTNYANYVMGGTQDNASPASKGNMASWKNLYAGDGAWSDFQPSNPAIHVTSAQNGSVYRYTTDGDLSPDGINANWGSVNFIAPLIYAGTSTLLIGANSTAMRWNGVAGSWTSSTNFGSNARTFAVGISNTARVYAGCNNGNLWRSDNTGTSWTQIDTTLPNNAIGGVAPSWTDSTDVIVGIQRSTGGLYRCSNTTVATPVWTSVSGSGATALPQTPINAVMRDPYQSSIWYVGTDIGAFMTTDSGQTWKNMNVLGLSNVHVNSFAIPNDKSYLYVGTFGRGIWRIPLINNTFKSFTLSSTEVYGDRSTIGTLTLDAPAPSGTRAILSEVSPYAAMPSSVTFGTGSTSAAFLITTSQVFTTNKIAYLYANLMGTTRSVALTIKPYPTVSAFTLAKTYLYGGASTTGTATISAPAPFTGSFTFTDNSSFVSVVSPVTISAGQTSKSTTVTTTKPATVQTATLTAAYKGTTRTATLSVYPHPVVTGLTFSPNPLLAGFYTTCTITFNVATPITTQVAMQDDSPYISTSAKTVPPGRTSYSFLIYGANPAADVDIAVQARVWEDTGPATDGTLRLLRSELTSIVVAPNPIRGGTVGIATVTINRRLLGSKIMTMASGNPNLAVVPASVTFPAGVSTVNASVRTVTVTSTQTTDISASYFGTTVRTTLTVNP